MRSFKLGGKSVRALTQFEPLESKIDLDSGDVGAMEFTVTTASKDGTCMTPHKRRNEISVQEGTCFHTYTFDICVTGYQESDSIVNLWQFKTKSVHFPKLSIGVRKSGDRGVLAYKCGSQSSVKLNLDAHVWHSVHIDFNAGTLSIDGHIYVKKFEQHKQADIVKFGVEADKDAVHRNIAVKFRNIKIT